MTSNPLPGGGPAPDVDSRAAPEPLLEQDFTETDLPALRRTVAAHAGRTAMPAKRINELILIVSELASNAIRHGGGAGRLRLWATASAVHCRISDDGPGLPDPSPVPQQPPDPTAASGRGLWLVLTFADDLRIETGENSGTTATATLRLRPRTHQPSSTGELLR